MYYPEGIFFCDRTNLTPSDKKFGCGAWGGIFLRPQGRRDERDDSEVGYHRNLPAVSVVSFVPALASIAKLSFQLIRLRYFLGILSKLSKLGLILSLPIILILPIIPSQKPHKHASQIPHFSPFSFHFSVYYIVILRRVTEAVGDANRVGTPTRGSTAVLVRWRMYSLYQHGCLTKVDCHRIAHKVSGYQRSCACNSSQ